MTEQSEAPDQPTVMPEQEIELKGRKMWARMPSPEQLLVWKRTLNQLQGADVKGWNSAQVMKALERSRMIVDSLLVHEVDKEWLDDEMLADRLKMMEAASIIQLTVDAFAAAAEAEGNRETQRAAKTAPAKKARRKTTPAP